MQDAYLTALGVPLVDIDVLIQSPVRVQIRTRTFWIGEPLVLKRAPLITLQLKSQRSFATGYNGKGPDPKLDGNHTNQKTFTIYRDGKIYVDATDTLLGGGGEHGGASGEHGPTGANSAKSTFIHPINALQAAVKCEVATVKDCIDRCNIFVTTTSRADILTGEHFNKEKADEKMGETRRLSFIISTIINFYH